MPTAGIALSNDDGAIRNLQITSRGQLEVFLRSHERGAQLLICDPIVATVVLWVNSVQWLRQRLTVSGTVDRRSHRLPCAVMRGNRGQDTTPAMALRSLLRAKSLRYRLSLTLRSTGRRIRPDIVFPPARLAVFVDGCF